MGPGDEESIYNLIPPEPEIRVKPPRHVSKFRGNVKVDETSGKASYKTMGPAKVQVDDPKNFLKKHTNDPASQLKKDEDEEKKTYVERKKPPVPTRDEKPVMGLKTNKNFIKQNAVENITAVPKKPEKKYVDSRKGDSWNLDTSGLEPKFVRKTEFGNTPEYLKRRKDEMRKAQEEYDAYVAEHFKRGAMQQMTNEERQSILKGLKTNWENLHHEYQGLSVVTDTAPKKNRKERMEAEMKQLERDIELIEKHRVIYIAA